MNLENKIMDLYNSKIQKVKAKKVINLLKFVLVDNKTNLYEIQSLVPIGINTIKKYISEKDYMLEFLTEEEYELLKSKIDYIFELDKKREEKEDLALVTKIIDDILNTRYRIQDICSNNLCQLNKFKRLFDETNYIEENFGIGVKRKIEEKIAKNTRERLNVPRNMFIIEDRYQIKVAEKNLTCLEQSDYKKLCYASDYLCSGANLEFTSQKNEVSTIAAFTLLSDKKIEQLLKKEHYDNLKRYLQIEMLLLSNDLTNKKIMLNDIVSKLYQFGIEKSQILSFYKLPEYLFDKLLLEIIKLPQFSNEIKEFVNILLHNDEEKKIK